MVYSKDVWKAVALAAFLATGALFLESCSKSLPFDYQVSKGVLGNGLAYYVQNNNTPGNTAVLKLIVNTGSVAEKDDQRALPISANIYRLPEPNISLKTAWSHISRPQGCTLAAI